MGSRIGHLVAVEMRELREVARSRTPFILRTAYGTLIGIAVYGMLLANAGSGMTGVEVSALSNWLFTLTAGLQSIVALALGILLGATSVTSEKRNRTLGLLVLSGLRHWEIVVGKLLSLVGLSVMIFIAHMPLLGLIGWAGGVDYAWLWKLAPLTLALAALGCSIGLAFGVCCRTAAAAIVWALMFTTLLLALPALVGRFDRLAAEWLAGVWIWSAPGAVLSQGLAGRYWLPLAIVGAISILMLAIAILAMRRAASAGSGRGLRGGLIALDRFFERINIGGLHLVLPRLAMWRGNPVAWLGLLSGGFGRGRYWIRFAVINFCACLLIISWTVGGVQWAGALIPVVLAIVFLVPLMAGATAVAGERSRRSLGILLATPLDARSILRGKLTAGLLLSLLAALPPVSVFLLVGYLSGELTWALEVGWVVLCAEAFCGFCLCLAASLLVGSSLRAGIIGVLLLLGANFTPILGAGVIWTLLGPGDLWAGVVLLLFVAGTLLSGAGVMLQSEIGLGRALLARYGVITLPAGFVSGLLGDPALGLMERVTPFDSGIVGTIFTLYLCFLGWVMYRMVVQRFDDSLERTT